MKAKTKTTEERETANNESNLGFKKGMLGKFVSMQEAKIKKGQQKRQKIPQNIIFWVFSKKGLMDKKQRKRWNFEREDKRKTRKKHNRKKTWILKTGHLGKQKGKKL